MAHPIFYGSGGNAPLGNVLHRQMERALLSGAKIFDDGVGAP
ncbi:MAG: hypothetical protein VYD18_15625 [Candidatus Latescibacterota bacterium]|nr:hypothetical protein [Candidatus Latescibacterota bacterium]